MNGIRVLPELLAKDTVRTQVLDNCSLRHIDNLVARGDFPSPVYLGRSPRWRRSDIEQWIADGCQSIEEADHAD